MGVVKCEYETAPASFYCPQFSYQGLLLFGILSGLHQSDAFGKDIGMTKIKAYMVFILGFTALTNSVVSGVHFHFLAPPNGTDVSFCLEICWIDIIPYR